MPCTSHPQSSNIDCPGCIANARAPANPNCPLCYGDGWQEPFPGTVEESCVAIPCDCWVEEAESERPDRPADVDRDGWLDGVTKMHAKYHGGKLDPARVDTIVMHCGSSDRETWGAYFQNPVARDDDGNLYHRKVSTHFGVRDDGRVEQYVPYDYAAWHSGVANFTSLGWEHRGPWRRDDWTEEAIASTCRLILFLSVTYPITRVVSHRFLCPKRRSDPGPHFPWDKIEALGLEVRP